MAVRDRGLGRGVSLLMTLLIPLAVLLAGFHSWVVPHHVCPETGAVMHGVAHGHDADHGHVHAGHTAGVHGDRHEHAAAHRGSTPSENHDRDDGPGSHDSCLVLALLGAPAPTVDAPTPAIGAVAPVTETGMPQRAVPPPRSVPPVRFAPKQSPPARTA